MFQSMWPRLKSPLLCIRSHLAALMIPLY
jgi:hypothetical protein